MTELARIGKQGIWVAHGRECGRYLRIGWRRAGAFAQHDSDGVVAVPGLVGHAHTCVFSVGVAGYGPQQAMGSGERLHGAGRPAVDAAEHLQHAVHIDAGHAPPQGRKTFHDDAPVGRVQGPSSIPFHLKLEATQQNKRIFMKKTLTIFIASAMFLLTAGCATGYREFYKPAAGIDAEQIALLRSGPPPENPIVERIGHVDPQAVTDAYIKRGYAIVGSSFFNSGRNESESSAIQMAKEVKADLVLIVNPKFTGSVTTSIPIVTPTTSTTYSTGTASAYGRGGYAAAYGSGVSTTYGNVTNFVPMTIDRVDYGAIFFVKPKISLGIVARDMNDEERQIAQTNMGAIVRVIINDTPAFYADILAGDRLLEIDGSPVYSAQAYTKMLKDKNGQKISLKLIRKGQILEKQIQLSE